MNNISILPIRFNVSRLYINQKVLQGSATYLTICKKKKKKKKKKTAIFML